MLLYGRMPPSPLDAGCSSGSPTNSPGPGAQGTLIGAGGGSGYKRLYSCHVCGYHTHIKRAHERHILTHTGEKPHKCDYCEFRSNRKDNLLTHVRKKHQNSAMALQFLLQQAQLQQQQQDSSGTQLAGSLILDGNNNQNHHSSSNRSTSGHGSNSSPGHHSSLGSSPTTGIMLLPP